ncbi:DUF2550 domain-containing protein [Tessaracoccus sp. OH4464_COT-324]|uniref:DUF2550 domain-containing protein n=1 Tax=Tessaracoccus sp. OH4464_COT-324 TaxID=2491059 RepID=UPI000F644DB7|nr:DUF2550 domain-containing protein [Tessaracoccus sp. OH4464_COT-324]RRD47893.1 DUF2550 family protein [Tessaracoccus sp. OH4464_COT-324]
MWWELAVVIALVVLLFVAVPGGLYFRRRWLSLSGGAFDCAVQLFGREEGMGWSLGAIRYRGEELQWFRTFSLAFRPRLRFRRGQTLYIRRSAPEGMDIAMLFENSMIVTIHDVVNDREYRLALDGGPAMALISWLESAPPASYILGERH